ncbi:MAG TPA: serine hydrolase domain-containing protein [Glaciihabitans sp.]|jgi:D-alanyl-D-alanine carboxypeptidase|nr:serine hydrolase domain-containing protein [Glaciihabitans sp.]
MSTTTDLITTVEQNEAEQYEAGQNEAGHSGIRLEKRLTARMQQLADAGFPDVLACVTTPAGEHTNVAVGVGNIAAGSAVPLDGEVRIGSNTKMYVAVVLLQLVEEGLLELDMPIDTYLPGLLAGSGSDGSTITVRQLMQHTSGLPEYADKVAADAFGTQHVYMSPRELLDIAFERPAVFAPGERWQYSNTNYVMLGLLIERMTETSLAEQIHTRIVEPLNLTHTYLPVPGERDIRGEHPSGYHVTQEGELREITSMDPAFAWAAGAMVASPSELNRFMQALLGGELLSAASLAEMQTVVPAGDQFRPEATYGLGLQSNPLSGGISWGHGGDIPGLHTRNAVRPDGTAVTIAVTALPMAVADMADMEKVMAQYTMVLDALDATLLDV